MHIPVLHKEVLDYLDPKPNENFIDCTVGEGGHSLAIVKRILPRGRLLGIDISPKLIRSFESRISNLEFRKNIILVNDSYTNLEKIVKKYKFGSVSGILLDLGLSSWHLETSGRGFSFLRKEPLDMRYDSETTILTAEKIVNLWGQEKIEKILREYGEERYAGRISKEIIKARKANPIRLPRQAAGGQVKNTFQLVEIIRKAVPRTYQHSRTHFAARTFQALRITVNDELNNLETVLPKTLKILRKGGRLVVISFHSLEDRIAKNFFREKAKLRSRDYSHYGTEEGLSTPNRVAEGDSGLGPILKILTKKPIRPSPEEIQINSRSRSAKLRAIIKI